ncbi:MAG: WD40 repeat domain-containing protein [Methanoregula sp.]|jgi:WD40 repeat protein
MKSCGNLPLISPWLYRREVRRVIRRVTAGDISAVRELAAVFCTSPDFKARDLAGQGLMDLKFPEQIDTLCRESLLRDNDALAALATGCGDLPAAPADRDLWLFCTSRAGELCHPDTGNPFPLLAAGYAAADEVVRARARDAARRDGTSSILARALAGTGITQNAPRWSYGEWEIVMTGISEDGYLDDLWLLVPLAPFPLAMEAIRALKADGWSPQGEDRILWNDLAKDLPDHWTYPLPAEKLREPIGRPAGQVSRLCFSPDGSLLATGCCDGMITVWCTTTAGLAAEFSAGPGSVSFLGIPAGNTCLISAGDDGMVRCHNLEDRSLLWSWNCRGERAAITLSPDSRTVIVGDTGGNLNVLDARDGQVLYTIPLHSSPVTCLAPSPAGPAIACGHADGTVSVTRPGDDTGSLTLPGNNSPVIALSFSPSGTECLAVYERALPVWWDITAGKKLYTFTGLTGRATCSAVPPGGSWFAIGSDDHSLRCWDLTLPVPVAVIPFYSRSITSCSASSDGNILAAGFHDGSIRIWRMPERELVREYKGHKKTVTSCTLAPGSNRFATVSWDGTTKLWRVPNGELVRTFDSHAVGITALAGPSGTLLATVTEDGIARVIDGMDGRTIRTIDLYTPSIRAAAMTMDGTFLVSTGTDSSIRCWNIRDGSLVSSGDRQATSFWCCTFLPDNPVLITGGWDGSCRFFTLPDVTPVRTLAGHTSTVTCCTVSRDGSLLVTGSNDTTIRIWRTDEDEAFAVLRDSRSEMSAVALSPDGTLLAAGNNEGIIQLYRLPYGTPGRDLPGIPGKITALAFTGDGCLLVAGYESGTSALFSVTERVLIRTLPAHSGAVTGLAILPDGRTLVSTGTDGLCRFHALPLMPFLVHASIADIPEAAPAGKQGTGGPEPDPVAFHRALLVARFQGEIGICPPMDVAGDYDIQIVG